MNIPHVLRLALLCLLIISFSGCAGMQTKKEPVPDDASLNGFTHAATGIYMPPHIGSMSLVDVQDYETLYPGMGYATDYSFKSMKATVYFYDRGMQVTEDQLAGEMQETMREVNAAIEAGIYEHMVPVKTPEMVNPGSGIPPYYRTEFTLFRNGIYYRSFTVLAAYKGYFVKVRVSHGLGDEYEPLGEMVVKHVLEQLKTP